MHYSPLVFMHICAATIGLLSGAPALFSRKGSRLHRTAGNVFFISILSMSASGAYMAAFIEPAMINVVVGVLTFYWDATGLKDGIPAAGYFVFGSVALLAAALDVGMFIRGGVSGVHRIARHLWRMCFAMLITTISF